MKKFNKISKQILCILFSSIFVMLSAITAFASADSTPSNNYSAQSEINNHLISLLANNGIQASVIDNQVVLDDISNVNKANKLLMNILVRWNRCSGGTETGCPEHGNHHYEFTRL